MKIGIDDLKPCSCCGGPLTGKDERCPIFRMIRSAPAVLDARAINQHLGLSQYFGGGGTGHALAGVMGAGLPAAQTTEDDDWVELFICNDCFCGEKFQGLHEAMENEEARVEAAAEKATVGKENADDA